MLVLLGSDSGRICFDFFFWEMTPGLVQDGKSLAVLEVAPEAKSKKEATS